MAARISIRDLARIASVSRTTVSLALRNSSKISAPVRQRIQELAAQHHYQSHPMVAALMQQIRSKKKIHDGEIIAFISSHDTPDQWKGSYWIMDLWRGASQEAKKLGFRLDHFWAGSSAENSPKLAKILYNRGIRGLIISPMPWPHPMIAIPWERFVSIACTTTTGISELPIVRSNHFRGIGTVLDNLRDMGARRIGVVWVEDDDERVSRAWSAGLHVFCLNNPKLKVRLLRLPSDEALDVFAPWYRVNKFDVIVAVRFHTLELVRKMGLKPGVDVACASLDVPTSELGTLAGFYQDPVYIGRRAVQHISKAIYDQSFGLPEYPESILINGKFVDGTTLNPLRRRS